MTKSTLAATNPPERLIDKVVALLEYVFEKRGEMWYSNVKGSVRPAWIQRCASRYAWKK
jgi:hypothetical protein